MWKSLSTIAIFTSLVCTNAIAQKKVNLPIKCDKPEHIAEVLVKYNEVPVFYGMDDLYNIKNLSVSVFLNKETKTYSVVLTVPESGLVCVMSSGEMGELVAK
jgi:hypothetical protein